MRKTMKRVLSLISTVTMLVTMVAVGGLTVPTTVSASTVLFSENFSSYANGSLPGNWTVSSDSGYTDIKVQDGRLVINGIGTDNQTRVVYTGSELKNAGDYIFEADYTVLESPTPLTSSTRYSAMMFRVSDSIYPYYYVTTRVRPGTNNELSIRKNSTISSYQQLSLKDPPAQQVIGQTYHLKVICAGANVKYYIDNTLVFNFTLETSGANYAYLDKGTIGFTTSNMKVAFDNIKVTETVPTLAAQPSMYDTYIPDTNIINPPSVITNVTNASVYETLTGTKLPSTTLYYLNKDMNITTPDGNTVITSLASALTKTSGKVIPALYIKDKATADALANFSIETALQDAFVVADTPELLKYAREKNVNFYGVLYTKLTTAASKGDLAEMYANTNKGWGKTVMVDAAYVSKDDVAYLQKRLMNVWVIGEGMTSEEKYENIYKGVNGIVDTDHANTLWIYESGVFNSSSDSTPILIREPFLYAHRGYSSYANQNTMEAFYGAIDFGADLIEMDVRLTSDGVVVIYHDEYLHTLTDCTDTTKKVENCTYAELMKYNVDDLKASGVPNSKIATLRQFLELIAQTDDVVGIIEIKNYDTNLVDKTAAIVKEMGMEHQVVSICFGRGYCDRMRQQLPGVSVGWLANGVAAHTTGAQIVNYAKGFIMSGNLSYHPNYGQIQDNSTAKMRSNVVAFAAQRGIAYNPWTMNDAKLFDYQYVGGIQGLTTDYLEFDNGYVRKIEAGFEYKVKEGTATALNVLGYTSQDAKMYNAEFKRTGGANVTFTYSNGKVTASGTGMAVGVMMYKVTTKNAGSYYAVSDLTRVTVSSSAGTNNVSGIRFSLLPQYTEKWTNVMANMNIDVTRDSRGEVLKNTTGSWPAVHHQIQTSVDSNSIEGITASLNDTIEFTATVDSATSVLIMLSDGTNYQLQKYASGLTLNGDDAIGNGGKITMRVKLSDMIPASSATNGNVVITGVRVFNTGDAGSEVVIKCFDLIRQVPAFISAAGDVDTNGKMETADVRMIINSTIGVVSLSHKQAIAGDYNNDGYVNSTDARDILKAIINA